MKKNLAALLLALYCAIPATAQTPSLVLDVSTPGFHQFPSLSTIPPTQAFIFKGVPFGFGLAVYFQNGGGTFSFNLLQFQGSYDPNYLSINNSNLPLTLSCQTSSQTNTLDISPTQFVKQVGVTSMTGGGTLAYYCAWPGISNYVFNLQGAVIPAGGLNIFAYTYPAANNFFFLTNASTTQAPGVTTCTGNPTGVSGTNVTGLPIPCDTTSTSANGLQLGHEAAQSFGDTIAVGKRCFGDATASCEALAVSLYGIKQVGGNSQTIGLNGNFAATGALMTSNAGQYGSLTGQTITGNGTFTINNINQGAGSFSTACVVNVNVTGPVTGTAPTLNLFFQDSDGDGTWNDRIAFNQITAINRQTASIWTASTTGVVPYSPTTGTLAVGTVILGPIQPQTRFQAVVTGTTPSFGGVNFYVNCN